MRCSERIANAIIESRVEQENRECAWGNFRLNLALYRRARKKACSSS